MIVPGFLLAALIDLWTISIPPDASMSWLMPPMVLRGMLLPFIVLATAYVTSRIFAS